MAFFMQLNESLDLLNILFIPMLAYVLLERRLSKIEAILVILRGKCPIYHYDESAMGCRTVKP